MSQYLKFEPDSAKTVEVIVYIANKIGDPTFFSIAKIMYYADKLCLRRYGRFICGETYFAMENGPVPTYAYRMMKGTSGEDFSKSFRVVGGYAIHPRRTPNLDLFSVADIECLDEAMAELGKGTFAYRRDATHDSAWHKTWDARGTKRSRRMPIEDIIATFPESEEILNYLLSGLEDEAD